MSNSEIISEKAKLRQQAYLEAVSEKLRANWNWKSFLVPDEIGTLIPMLIVEMGTPEDDAEVPIMNMMFVPTGMEDETYSAPLQLYAQLYEGPLSPEVLRKLQAQLPEFNIQLPIGHFGLRQDNEVYYRYIIPVAQFEQPDESLLLEVLQFFVLGLQTFQPKIVKFLEFES